MCNRKLSLEEIQQAGFEILLEFVQVCQKYGLRYQMCYGSLWGTIRYKSFLPWDDDIDICMPRPDYEKLIELDQKEQIFSDSIELINFNKGTFRNTFSKLINKKVECEHAVLENYVNNLFIDINPFDGVPKEKREITKITKQINFWKSINHISMAKKRKSQSLIKGILTYFLRPIAKLIGSERCIKQIYRIRDKYPYEECDFVGGLVEPDFIGACECVPKVLFENTEMREFNGLQVPVMKCWDSFLKGKFGNYWEIEKPIGENKHFLRMWIKEGKPCEENWD